MRQNCCKLDQCVTGQFHYRHEITYSAVVALALFYEPINNRVFPAPGSATYARLATSHTAPRRHLSACYCPLDKQLSSALNFVFLLARLRDQANLFGRDARMTPSQGQVFDAFFRCCLNKPADAKPTTPVCCVALLVLSQYSEAAHNGPMA